MIGTWTAPLQGGETAEELLLSFDRDRASRLLVLPAWFDEANKLRRFTLEVMRGLDESGIDSFLPDLPGCNESLVPLETQTIADWRAAALEAAEKFAATHVLAVRAGALIAPPQLPGWRYAPQSGPKQLRGMIRARTIAAREEGREESSEALMGEGRNTGLVLAGWPLGAELFRELAVAGAEPSQIQQDIPQSQIGGAGLWLRAEPDHDRAQAAALAGIIASSLGEKPGEPSGEGVA
ncbi:hypothetical protein [Erythrobacter sp.]|uniref:hypothetical protein n=1 Tax=Erythrobacter sp. TaxID=1042 RepID=UPI002EAB2D35|nr:hypothetical protein [Erythrobacter sp.]